VPGRPARQVRFLFGQGGPRSQRAGPFSYIFGGTGPMGLGSLEGSPEISARTGRRVRGRNPSIFYRDPGPDGLVASTEPVQSPLFVQEPPKAEAQVQDCVSHPERDKAIPRRLRVRRLHPLQDPVSPAGQATRIHEADVASLGKRRYRLVLL